MIPPKKIAQQIRPLIGLNVRQAQANVNYRERIFNRFVEQGLPATTANQRADKAALKYASKQHRQRAETITHTELARAYNQGAHEGILTAQRAGLMGRCEMVWSTAGTNRVCGRCLALKDTVVGHTDESGVTLPPLHPRCRCTIIYRETPLTSPARNGNVGGRGLDAGGIMSGALNPDSVAAEQHAFRYYGLVRSMKTDCKRIALNTGFREEDIRTIKNHVFYAEHELYDGERARFYPSYHMAQSWQRLIDGRNIHPEDILLLNHEFFESVLESQGLNAEQAHRLTEKVYNYSATIN